MHRLLPVLAALVTVVTACSGGDEQREAGGPRSTSTSTTVATTSTTAAPPAPTTTMGPSGVTTLPTGDPVSVASTLARTESAIREPGTATSALEGLGVAQQAAYRQLAEHPEWMEEVLARVPGHLHGTVRANTLAGRELRALTKPRTDLPPWRIVAPAPAEELLGYYKEAESRSGVPWEYLASIHLVETRMGRIRGTSVAGAQGPMQFLPSTWKIYGEGDINSNRDAILAAARLLDRNGAPDNMANALFSYNRSQRYVRAVTAYAEQMRQNERAYLGYYHWQVYYRMVDGDRLLPVGYSR
ncbi:MAG TPA: lytic transglycosylase domain-containing protein [Acidimicrobiales bacterium]|nr:lytic transglycosylase domain-containing protein [Acidimicrobiales bacterium]